MIWPAPVLASGSISAEPTSVRSPGWRAFIWVALGLALVYLPIFLGRIVFFRDIAHWTFPARWFASQSLRRGELPTWNPYQGLGFPVLGDPLYALFYPPNWLFLLTGPEHLAQMLTWQHFAHLLWGAAGVFALATRLGCASRGAAISALAWSLCGYITSEWSSGARLFVDCWVPWIAVGQLALLDRLRAGGRQWLGGVARAALPVALSMLSGEVFITFMGVGFALALLLVKHLVARRADPALPSLGRRGWAAMTLALCLGMGVAAVMILPARMVLGQSDRAAPLDRARAEACSLHPLRLVELAAPGCMGDPYGDYPASRWVGEPALDGLPLSYSVYMGAGVLALVLAAFGRQRHEALALGGLTVALLLVAMGKYLPVHALFRRVVFPLSYMRYPEKYLGLVSVGTALLAGQGAERILSPGRQPWRRNLALGVLLVALALGAACAMPFPWSGFMSRGAQHGAAAVLVVLGVQALVARASRVAPVLLPLVVGLDLSSSVWSVQGFAPAGLAAHAPSAARRLLVHRREDMPPPRLYRSPLTDASLRRWTRASNHAEGELRLLASLIPSTINVWGIAALPGYDAGLPAALSSAWNAGAGDRLASLRLLAAEYAVLPHAPGAVEPPGGARHLFDPLPGAGIFRIEDPLPRVFVAQTASVQTDDQVLARLGDPAVTSGRLALLAPGADVPTDEARPANGSCQLESYGPRRLQARCESSQRSLAVFVEQFAPGWEASVDGQPTPILRANLVMRAVSVQPGAHRIVMEYHAPGLAPGAIISLVALLALLGLSIASRRQA